MSTTKGTIHNRETGLEIHGEHLGAAAVPGNFGFTMDGVGKQNVFVGAEWDFTPDPEPKPTYPVLSVATGGVYVPAVKTFTGWVYVNENGSTFPVEERVILARIKSREIRISYHGQDITETGAKR